MRAASAKARSRRRVRLQSRATSATIAMRPAIRMPFQAARSATGMNSGPARNSTSKVRPPNESVRRVRATMWRFTAPGRPDVNTGAEGPRNAIPDPDDEPRRRRAPECLEHVVQAVSEEHPAFQRRSALGRRIETHPRPVDGGIDDLTDGTVAPVGSGQQLHRRRDDVRPGFTGPQQCVAPGNVGHDIVPDRRHHVRRSHSEQRDRRLRVPALAADELREPDDVGPGEAIERIDPSHVAVPLATLHPGRIRDESREPGEQPFVGPHALDHLGRRFDRLLLDLPLQRCVACPIRLPPPPRDRRKTQTQDDPGPGQDAATRLRQGARCFGFGLDWIHDLVPDGRTHVADRPLNDARPTHLEDSGNRPPDGSRHPATASRRTIVAEPSVVIDTRRATALR
jgi:hypothetical protein